MAEGKKKVIVYADWINQFKDLTDEEAGKLIKHFFEYINDLNPVSDRLIELLFNPIKATLKRDLESWLNKQKTNKENGLKGGRPKKTETQNNPNNPVGFLETQNNPQKGVSVNDNVNDNVKVNDKVNVNVKDINNYFKELPTSSNFELIAIALNIPKDKLTLKIAEFKKTSKLNYLNFNEFCHHFKNYVNKNNM